ncbi:hypothetical protein JZU54_03780 [bacterium]|jgi:hypothetical protein|nr:hypothetical protein [bacterium]
MKSLYAYGAALVLAVLISGCDASSGKTARIQEKSAVFAQLTPEQKKSIESGSIEVGYTADMVYMALGKPSKVKSKESPEGKTEMWTYNNFAPAASASHLSLGDPSRDASMPTETLYVFFHKGAVADIKVERS